MSCCRKAKIRNACLYAFALESPRLSSTAASAVRDMVKQFQARKLCACPRRPLYHGLLFLAFADSLCPQLNFISFLHKKTVTNVPDIGGAPGSAASKLSICVL